ncbi:MAG: glycoside hydrolase family protein [Proteobacteria bacterium]|nr:glycoside hydrolase family protein [Pseudomonadota bacterium]
MIQSILCAVFAICTAAAPVPPQNGAPTWPETATHLVPLLEQEEGLPCNGDRCEAYLDRIASPPVPTICSGITVGVRMGDVRTRAECRADLRREAQRYWQGFRNSLTETGYLSLTVWVDVAFSSLTYNIGIGAVSGSTAVRRLNAGDVRGACEALTWWTRAGVRARILFPRRQREHAICIRGLP